MIKCLKLNGVSALYGLHFAMQIELMLESYRLARVTGIELGQMNTIIGWAMLVILIAASFLMYCLTNLSLGSGGVKFWTSAICCGVYVCDYESVPDYGSRGDPAACHGIVSHISCATLSSVYPIS